MDTGQPTRSTVLDDIVVADPKMLEVIAAAKNVAPHKAAVLITGETGVGKELVARIIHEHSPRRARPWVDLNCAALPEHLVESELFGYEKGAFSGADVAKPGLFEVANGGSLFLGEIGDLEPKVQAKLLRVLDGVPYYRLGGSRKVSVDVRLVAATNRDLDNDGGKGGLRSDLYHRISEVHLRVPPLRERPEDIPALARHFLERCRPGATLSPQALEFLVQLEWPGNVRELRNLVVELAILTPHPEITIDDILQHMKESQQTQSPNAVAPVPEILSMVELQRQMIVQALRLTSGNQTLAAQHLGIPRRTFCRRLNQLQIPVERRRSSTAETSAAAPLEHRTRLDVPVSITTEDGRRFTADACNLSVGGLGLQNVSSPLTVGEKLTIGFALPGNGKGLELRGIVVWWQPNGTAGIRFEDVSDSEVEMLHRWLAGNRQMLLPGASKMQPLECEQVASSTAVRL